MNTSHIKPFTGFPLPPFHALVCPHCNVWKMYETKPGSGVFLCAGRTTLGKLTTCGKYTTRLEIELFVGQTMVEE